MALSAINKRQAGVPVDVESADAIVVRGLRKSYKDFEVLRNVTFSVKRGEILALLGPNGAGKTTTVRILSTLLSPGGGTAAINGYDVTTHGDHVRKSIGLTGQYAAVDEYLTGEENLVMIGRLYHLTAAEAQKRAKALLKQFDLVDAGGRSVKTYSGGMRRRLDLAMSLIGSPPIIFLDEPTTGLDPPSRLAMWHKIKELARAGTTILLTTQYMEEADFLADRIIVLNDGRIIASGTADELKRRIGAEHVEVRIGEGSDFQAAKRLLGKGVRADADSRTLSITAKNGTAELKRILQAFEAKGIDVEGITLAKPTLDDVFLKLTGHAAIARERRKRR